MLIKRLLRRIEDWWLPPLPVDLYLLTEQDKIEAACMYAMSFDMGEGFVQGRLIARRGEIQRLALRETHLRRWRQREDEGDYRYWIRLNSTIDHFKLPIDTWIVQP